MHLQNQYYPERVEANSRATVNDITRLNVLKNLKCLSRLWLWNAVRIIGG